MKIDFNNNNGNLNVALEGRLDTTTAPELESFIEKNYIGAASLVIDCEKLVYISSLRQLMKLKQYRKHLWY